MDESLSRAVCNHFFAKMTKNLSIDSIDFKAGLVLDDSAGLEGGGSFGLDRGLEEQSRLREKSLAPGKHLGQPNRPRAEDDGMTSLDDSDIRLPPFLRDPAVNPRREPVGMKSAVEHLKCKVRHPRAAGSDTHDQIL
jgi:hypothetical protein